MLKQLKDRLKGKVVVVGIGNTLRGDDGAGPELIKRLKNSLQFTAYSLQKKSQLFTVNCELVLMDVGEVPENYLEKIAGYKPDVILLVDAVNLGGPPGSIKIVELEVLVDGGLSTHNASLKLVIEYLKKETKADILLMGIQPGNLKINSELSKPVKQALNRIEDILRCVKDGEKD